MLVCVPMSYRCEMKDVLLEMDRILRPEGIVIIRDGRNFLENAEIWGKAMRWECSQHDTEQGPADVEGLLFCRKQFWQSSETANTWDHIYSSVSQLQLLLSKILQLF